MANYTTVSTTHRMGGTTINSDPTDLYDRDNGWRIGDTIVNTLTSAQFVCVDNAPGAAIWRGLTGPVCMAQLTRANMNTAGDQSFGVFLGTPNSFRVSQVLVLNASVPLTNAIGGIYRAASRGGIPLVGSTQHYSTLTSASSVLSLTLAPTVIVNLPADGLRLSLTTPQGAAATADFFVYGEDLS
jgi:hypothetical protein